MNAEQRLNFLRHLVSTEGFIDDIGLVRALVRCLGETQAASLLLAEAQWATSLRDAALRKVTADAGANFLPIHRDSVMRLLQLLSAAPSSMRTGVAYCLSTLLPTLPFDLRNSVLAAFATSKYIGLRRRAYKALSRETEPPIDLILQAWRDYDDPECTWLIVKILPPQFLFENRALLEAKLTEGWQLSRFYLRISEVNPTIVKELLKRDPISYCYVLAKLGQKVSMAQARAIIRRSEADERLGLLIWSFGIMELWDVLRWVGSRLPDMQNRRIAALVAKHGI